MRGSPATHGPNNAEAAAANESYAYFPSEGSPELGGVRRGLRLGDTRAAAAPFAAHRHFGESYKWMLYGDDDTIFLLDAVRDLLAPYDPDLPYAFSDNLWHADRHPNPHAPRCLPCHMAGRALPSLKKVLLSEAGRVEVRLTLNRHGLLNPTDADEVAFAANATQVPGERFLPRPACPVCSPEAACRPLLDSGSKAECQPSVAHGGAGMIFSVGLLRAIPYRSLLACLLSFSDSKRATGGDAMVSHCLWRHGIAFTDPGPLVQNLYDRRYAVFNGWVGITPFLDPNGPPDPTAEVPGQRTCKAPCLWALRHAVSMHTRARACKSTKALAELQEILPQLRREAYDVLILRNGTWPVRRPLPDTTPGPGPRPE